MRNFIILLFFLFSANIFAQLEDNAIAPDFTLSDINGTSHHLYEYLDNGKSVILNFSATWNDDSWLYHSAGVLQDINSTYGAEGSDEVVVLFIESDILTGMNDLQGSGPTSQGNFINLANFPIIDIMPPPSIISDYQVDEFPTIYFVSPNHLVKNVGQVGVDVFEELIENAPPAAAGQNNAAILSYTGDITYCEGLNASLIFQNLGSADITSASFSATSFGDTFDSAVWTGNLAPFEFAEVFFPTIITDDSNLDLVFEIEQVNGTGDDDLASNAIFNSIERLTADTEELIITIQTDDFGYEIYWALLDEADGVVAEGGNLNVGLDGGGLQNQAPGGYGNNSEYINTIQVEDGACYKFVIVDDWGDGLTDNGFFKLDNNDGSNIIQGGDFESIDIRGIENEVSEAIVAGYSYSINELTVSFNNETTGDNINSYAWDFGDGNGSSSENPTHIYDASGVYTVTLTVTDTDGTSTTYSETVTISFEAITASFSYSIEGLTVNFINESTGDNISSYLWEFGDGNTSNSENPVHIYDESGSYTVILTVFDSSGGSIVISEPIGVTTSTGNLLAEDVFNVYPIPSNGVLNIDIESRKIEEIQIRLVNSIGKLVFNSEGMSSEGKNTLEIETSNLPNGVYILQLLSRDGVAYKKIEILNH